MARTPRLLQTRVSNRQLQRPAQINSALEKRDCADFAGDLRRPALKRIRRGVFELGETQSAADVQGDEVPQGVKETFTSVLH